MSNAGRPAADVLCKIVADDLLTAREAAAVLGVSPWTLVDWRRPGNVRAPALPWGYARGRVVYRRGDLDALLADAASAFGGPGRGAA